MTEHHTTLSRRELLGLAVASPVLAAFGAAAQSRTGQPLDRQSFADARWTVVRTDGATAASVEVIREWSGPYAEEASDARMVCLFNWDDRQQPFQDAGSPGRSSFHGPT